MRWSLNSLNMSEYLILMDLWWKVARPACILSYFMGFEMWNTSLNPLHLLISFLKAALLRLVSCINYTWQGLFWMSDNRYLNFPSVSVHTFSDLNVIFRINSLSTWAIPVVSSVPTLLMVFLNCGSCRLLFSKCYMPPLFCLCGCKLNGFPFNGGLFPSSILSI